MKDLLHAWHSARGFAPHIPFDSQLLSNNVFALVGTVKTSYKADETEAEGDHSIPQLRVRSETLSQPYPFIFQKEKRRRSGQGCAIR